MYTWNIDVSRTIAVSHTARSNILHLVSTAGFLEEMVKTQMDTR